MNKVNNEETVILFDQTLSMKENGYDIKDYLLTNDIFELEDLAKVMVYAEEVLSLDEYLDDTDSIGRGAYTLAAVLGAIGEMAKDGLLLLITDSYPIDFTSPVAVAYVLKEYDINLKIIHIGKNLPNPLRQLSTDIIVVEEFDFGRLKYLLRDGLDYDSKNI